MPGCRVDAITSDDPDHLQIDAHGTHLGGRCPDCGRASRDVHSRYHRHLSDLPSLGRCVRVALRVRRFYCRNPGCARRTFAERLQELVVPHARRTRRLAAAQGRAGVALGGEAGARLLRHLAMPTSADTVLHLIRRLPLPEVEAPRVVAVDDWAIRKGRSYGTIMVDLERRRVVDLLGNRTSATVLHGSAGTRWCTQHAPCDLMLREADVLGTPKLEHAVQRVHGDGDFGRSTPIGAGS